jgi:hypothetical protein
MSRFEERLAEDRAIVGDGGTGALCTFVLLGELFIWE